MNTTSTVSRSIVRKDRQFYWDSESHFLFEKTDEGLSAITKVMRSDAVDSVIEHLIGEGK